MLLNHSNLAPHINHNFFDHKLKYLNHLFQVK